MILETHHTGQDQSRYLALRMRARNWILRGIFPQMLLHLVHHLVGFGVLENPLMIWLRFIPQTEDALSGFAHRRKSIHPLLCQVPRRRVRFLLLDVIPGSTPSTLLSMTECSPGFNRLDPLGKLCLFRQPISVRTRQTNHGSSLRKMICDWRYV